MFISRTMLNQKMIFFCLQAPSRRSTTRKDSKSSNSNMKEVNDAKRKIAVVEDADECASPVTPNRTSLRRNIQRPKWLTDADLVTDYEFPRGTNVIMRTGNGNSTSTSTITPAMNINLAKARNASSESNEGSGKNQKSGRGKTNPPPSVERKAKQDATAPKVSFAINTIYYITYSVKYLVVSTFM